MTASFLKGAERQSAAVVAPLHPSALSPDAASARVSREAVAGRVFAGTEKIADYRRQMTRQSSSSVDSASEPAPPFCSGLHRPSAGGTPCCTTASTSRAVASCSQRPRNGTSMQRRRKTQRNALANDALDLGTATSPRKIVLPRSSRNSSERAQCCSLQLCRSCRSTSLLSRPPRNPGN